MPRDRGASSAATPPRTAIVPVAFAEDGDRFLVGPVVQHALEQVQVGSGGQRVEEALPLERDPFGGPGVGHELAGPGDGAGEVEESAVDVGMAA